MITRERKAREATEKALATEREAREAAEREAAEKRLAEERQKNAKERDRFLTIIENLIARRSGNNGPAPQ